MLWALFMIMIMGGSGANEFTFWQRFLCRALIVCVITLAALGGWKLVELVIWLFKHVNISIG